MTKQLFSKLNCFVRITARVIPCLVALFVAQLAVAQEVPTFTPIGNFNANSGAMFVSADGNMVTGLSANQTFRWSTTLTEMISLGRLAGSELPAIATSASSDGSVVVGFSESWNEIPLQSTRKVVFWTPAQGWIDLGTPFESGEYWDWNSEPRISANGSVVLAMSSGSLGNKLWRWTAEGWSNLGQAPNQSAWISGSQRISDNGSVIIANAFNQAFRWTSSGWVGLGFPSASTSFYANCMSSDGSVVVGLVRGSDQQTGIFTSIFRWSSVDGIVNLGSPQFCILNGEELFVSGDGSVIAGSALDSQRLPHIFRLALESEFQDLTPLPENHTHADVAAINQDGTVLVGFSQRTNFQTGIIETTQPFRWTVASGMSSLGLFPGEATDALPKAMNNDGSVIVGVMGRQVQGLPEQFVDIRAFRWTVALGMTVLGTFQTAIHPEDLSRDGSILVGTAEFGSFIHSNEHLGFGDHAFRWSSALLQDLGVNTMQGEFNSHAEFVSGDGSTVVGTMKFDGGSSPDFSRAFRVTSSGVKVDLGTLRAAGGEFDSSSYIKSHFSLSSSGYEQESGKRVSSNGSVIVGTSESFVSDIPVRRAFRWTSSGMSSLGTLGVGESSAALAVSSDGLTVVGASGNFQTHLTRAFRWTSGNGMVSLGKLNGTDSSAAFFTSNNGAVVVGTCTGFNGPNEVREAFRWKDGIMASLGSLPGGAQDLYWPVAINDDGSVVVGLSENTDAQGITTRRAFRWTTVSGMKALPDAITDLHGLSLSGNGAIVVGSRVDDAGGKIACLWSYAIGLVELRTYLVGLGVANLAGINLIDAGISKDGKSIAVTYQVDGRDAAGIVRGLQFVTSNDDCANALSIELGSVSFNTAGSTTDGNNPTAQYCGPVDGGFFNDVWYSFTPSSTGIFSASTCNQANFDTRIDILDGCGGTLLACDDDACGNLSTHVEFSGVAGQMYLIRLGAYSNTFGTGTLTLDQVVSVPTISSVSPSSGTTLGGTAITITGTNLTGASSVTVGGVAATSVVVVSSTSITAVTPAGTEGAKDVAVTTARGTASLPSAFTFVVPTPTISGVSPSSGPTLGGTAITITGTNLTGASSVTIGGVAATSVNVVSSTSITAVTPAGSAGAKSVAVTTAGGTASLPSAFIFVVPTPTISGVSPSSGTTLGGTAITITGTELTGASSVTFGGVAATSVIVVSSRSITAVTPAGTAGAKSVAVTTPGGTASMNDAFTYRTPGSVVAWGYNEFGQCTIPLDAQSDVFSIACGVNHTMALKDGQVFAWGSNGSNQCIVPVAAQSGVTAIAGGGYFSIALKDGVVLAWGDNGNQQCNVPVVAQSGVTAIAGGQYHTTALKAGAVLGWGNNGDGRSTTPSAAQSGVSAIACGYYHTLALKDGQVLAWGENIEGQCNVPVAAQSGVTAIAGGMAHSIALKDGQVFAWGQGNAGQCTVPAVAQSGVTAIAGCAEATIALIGGQVFAWGSNGFGQCLGTDSNGNAILSGPTGQPVQVGGSVLNGVTDISGGQFHASAIKSGGGNQPEISSVSPSSGPTTGGTTITIGGTNLTGATVKVGDVSATVLTNTATSITATTPTGTAGAKIVSVDTSGGTFNKVNAFTYVVVLAPTISSVSPFSGTTLGGTAITITGTNLTGATSVTVAGVAATSVNVVSSTSITAVAPAGTEGAQDVAVTTPGGTATATSAFTYINLVAPTGVAASDGLFTNKISVSWNAAANANGYQLFRGATKIADIASGATVSYDDSDVLLTPGTLFTYTVKALFTAGVSAPSSSDTGFVGFAIVAPTGVAASDGLFTNKISVSWNAAANANGYQLFRGATKIADIASGATVAYDDVDGSLTPGTSFSYTVKALFTAGVSAPSASDTGFVGFAIVAPTGVAASDGLFTNKISVSWNAAANANGYQLFRGATKIADIASGATVSYNDVDGALTPGTSFTYTVKALFTAGVSAPSASDTGFVGFAIVAPTGVSASDGTLTTGVALTWNQQLGATGYHIFRSGTVSPIAVLGSVGSYIDFPPLSGKLYTYSLKGIFTAGISALSASDSGWQNLVAPSMVAASDGTLTSGVTVTWSSVTGGTGYKIFRSETEIATVGSSSLLFNDTTAIPGTSYEYFVKTNSSAGTSAPSLSNSGYRNLSAPTGVAASDGTSQLHVSVTWVASIGATGYQVWRANGTGVAAQIGTSTATPFYDVGASPGIAYSYTVRATSAVGVSVASAGNTGFRALSAPTGVAASDGTSATSVIVTWTAVPGATAYKIFRSGSAAAIGTVGAVTTFSNTSAAVGVLYTYTVKAVYGTLGMSAASSGDTGYRNRPAPANVNATDTDTTKVRITWSAVTGSTGYEVFRSIGGATATLIASPTALLFDDTAIARGTTAVYSVRAKFVLTGSSPAATVTTLMSVTNSGTRP